ncbi:recombination regulator RecX [Halalkalibacterium ligniniphilum]|uniref:recombination regulator RecX n=1 Tax=Halalkalibacterium ligniniphilum TaxID=1134413 RepID=UPI00034AF686|nr:recombination regulator RecX [Halalkalibacterium ligniniphilum]
MVKITRIVIQKRNNERFNVYVDRGNGEEYGFSVDQNVLVKRGLKKGLEIEKNELDRIIYDDEIMKAFHLCLNYLSFRMRSEKEIKNYLLEKGREQPIIDEVIERLKMQNLVNDRAFAKAYVHTKQKTTSKGPQLLKQELKAKGVGETFIEEALSAYSHEEQKEFLKKWIEKQSQRSTKDSAAVFKRKLGNRLLQKGFSYSVIESAMEQVNLEIDENEEWEALCLQGEKAWRKYQGKLKGWELLQRVKQTLYRKGFPLHLIEQYLSRLEKENE